MTHIYIYIISTHFPFVSTLLLEQMYRTKKKLFFKNLPQFHSFIRTFLSRSSSVQLVIPTGTSMNDIVARHRFPEIRQHAKKGWKKVGAKASGAKSNANIRGGFSPDRVVERRDRSIRGRDLKWN